MTRAELDAQKKENKARFDRTVKRRQAEVDNVVAGLEQRLNPYRPADNDRVRAEISAVRRAWDIEQGEMRHQCREEDRALVEKFNAELD